MSGEAKGVWRTSRGDLEPERRVTRRSYSKKGILEVFEQRRAQSGFGAPQQASQAPSHPIQPPAPQPRPAPASRSAPVPLALPPSHKMRDPLAPFLPSDLNVLNSGPTNLRPDWPGFKVESLALGVLDQRTFRSFAVERDCGIKQGLLRVGEEEGKAVAISGYAFENGPPIKVKFNPGSLKRIYVTPTDPSEGGGSGVDAECERIGVVLETRWTPQFHGYFSTNDAGHPTGMVRVNALDRKHLDAIPLLSRHFLLTLTFPRDQSLAGQLPTPFSLQDLLRRITNADYLPNPTRLPHLDVLPNTQHYHRKTLTRLASTFSSVPPPIAYQLEALFRDGCILPSELMTLVEEHVRPWMDTATVPYGERLAEDILERLQRILVEDGEMRAMALELGVSRNAFSTERDWEWALADKAAEAHDAVIEGWEQKERDRKEKLEAGLKVKTRKEDALSNEHFWCRTIGFTPSRTVLVMGRTLEMSNALIRKYYRGVDYGSESDFFLRVVFVDEDGLPLPGGTGAAYDRLIDGSLKAMMLKGLRFGGRTYQFLAYSQSGQRERTVWFVAPWPVETNGILRQVTAADIRKDLGDFEKVSKLPAKLGSRLSQAFTSSRASIFLRDDQILELDDMLVLDQYGHEITNHTDGAGLMSVQLRDQAWQALLNNGFRRDADGPPPTVFQFRLGGYKGVLAVDPTLPGVCVALRPSQRKFDAFQDDPASASFCLNIADVFTRPNNLFLNRPLISALDDGGVDTLALLALQRRAVDLLAPSELQTLYGALAALKKYSVAGATRFKSLLSSFFELRQIPDAIIVEEPFLRESLQTIRVRSLRNIRNKTRVPVDDAWSLVGVPDEDSFLKPGQVYAALVFPDKPEEPQYLKGKVAITRSPVVDPGDIRIVEAIGELPQGRALRLAGLTNCIVLPTTGDRSLASMMGGGDVDGDKFDIIPLPELIPRTVAPPRSHEADPPLELDHEATIKDVASCFIEYARNDCLGVIAHRHLIFADSEPEHGYSAKCQGLADLYSRAVDTPKTGVVIHREELPKAPKLRPDFLRFTDGDSASDDDGLDYYTSTRALGVMYRDVDVQELKTPPAVLEGPPLIPTAIDSTSRSFQILRLVIERRLSALFDCTPAHLERLVVEHHSTLQSKLISFASSLSQYAVQFSQPRACGRKLSEYEIFSVTPLLETDRKIDRSNQIASLDRQIHALVRWLEKDLTTREPAGVETLAKRYAAWVVARGMDEWEFGVKTARWTTLALLLESLQEAEKEKKDHEERSSPATRFSSEAVPHARPKPPPIPPRPPQPTIARLPGGLPTSPDSPPNACLEPSRFTSPPDPRPRIPHDTRPTSSVPPGPLPPPVIIPAVPRPQAIPATSDPYDAVLFPFSDRDPWQIRARQAEAYGDVFNGFCDPAEDYVSDDESSDEAERMRRVFEPLKVGAGPVQASSALPIGIGANSGGADGAEGSEDEVVWQERVAVRIGRKQTEDQARVCNEEKEEREEWSQRKESQTSVQQMGKRADVRGKGSQAVDAGSRQAEKAGKAEGGDINGSPGEYHACTYAPYSSFADVSCAAQLTPPHGNHRHVSLQSARPCSPPHRNPPPSPSRLHNLHHPIPVRTSLPLPSNLDHPFPSPLPPQQQQQQHHQEEPQQQYRFDPPADDGWSSDHLPLTSNTGEHISGLSRSRVNEEQGRELKTRSEDHPPTPLLKRGKYGAREYWKGFTDADQCRYASNKTGLGKLGRYMVTADGETCGDAYGLGKSRSDTPDWKRQKKRERQREETNGGRGELGDEKEHEPRADEEHGRESGNWGEGWTNPTKMSASPPSAKCYAPSWAHLYSPSAVSRPFNFLLPHVSDASLVEGEDDPPLRGDSPSLQPSTAPIVE
ncbi:hypothetical protein JCM11251_006311 [Rhodosporidiobolus azoricus]